MGYTVYSRRNESCECRAFRCTSAKGAYRRAVNEVFEYLVKCEYVLVAYLLKSIKNSEEAWDYCQKSIIPLARQEQHLFSVEVVKR